MDSPTQRKAMWRFQTGPMKHLGLTRGHVLCYQKSAITGSGRLNPVHLHLVADLASGRVLAEASVPEKSDPTGFFVRALRDAASIGGPPQTVVVSRNDARDFPQLLKVATNAMAAPVFATQSFKLRQKISRHFEDYLHAQVVGHAALAQWDNFLSCLPRLVAAWNVDGQLPIEQRPSRYAVGCRAVEAELGPDPRRLAEHEFQQRRIEVHQIDVQPGRDPGFHFSDRYGVALVYLGFDLLFTIADRNHRVPLFAAPTSPHPSWQTARALRNFDPNLIHFCKADMPVELRSAWRIDDQQLNRAITARDLLWAMSARGVPLADLACLLRKLIAACVTERDSRHYPRFTRAAETKPAPPVLAAGVTYANESWERIRDRHFWRAHAHWDAGGERPIPFARVQVEADGRVNALPESSLLNETSSSLNELLRGLFLRGPDLAVPPSRRQEILLKLREDAAARLGKIK